MHRFVALLACWGVVAACAGTDPSAPGARGDGAEGSPVSAVAAVYPLSWLAEEVAPEADVTTLNAGGLQAHDVEITPGQRQAVETADVVLFVGDIGYQPQVEQAVGSARGEVVSVAEVAGPERLLEPVAEAHVEQEPAAEAHHGDGAAEAHSGEEAVVDPHIWFDAEVMADVAVRTGEAFATADPGNAETYRNNARAVSEELAELGRELDATLGGECRHLEVIVSHQAYGYLLAPLGVAQHGVTGINPQAGASSAELAELVEEIEREGFGHVLTEPQEGREGAETVAREADVELLEISPLDAVTDEQAGAGFIELVRAQAAQFATALGC